MKKATLFVSAVNVQCPECGELVEDPFNGSQMWDFTHMKGNDIRKCTNCGEYFRLPQSVREALNR